MFVYCGVVTALQQSLFDTEEVVGPRPLDPSLEREDLGDGAWIDVRREWIAGSDVLFELLHTTVPWRSERRRMYDRTVDVPRLLAFYEEGAALPDPVLVEAQAALADHYRNTPGAPFCTAGICLYRDGQDSVAFHGDTIGRAVQDDKLVAIVSLGEHRRFLLRPKSGGPSLKLSVGHGDLLVMGGSCHRTWEHAVPKTARPVGPRISIQFRSAGVT
jgi:alkylated DNA repair dioxygenase AlkB